MLSLNDEISKFDKLAQTLKDDTMSIDEKFFGGGVTVKDLIQENNFIITENRKIKDVFLNFCKLNDKVYKKIIEHEVSANNQTSRITTIGQSIDRRIETFTTQNKKIKESIQSEIHSNRQFIDNQMKKIKEDLKNKVSQEGFKTRIKNIIDEYENQDEDDQNENTQAANRKQDNPENQTSNNLHQSSSPLNIGSSITKKRKGGLTLQDIQAFKSQITPLIDQVNTKIDEHKLNLQQITQNVKTHMFKISKLNEQSIYAAQDILTLKSEIQKVKKQGLTNNQNINKELSNKISHKQSQDRFIQFQSNKLRTLNNNIMQYCRTIKQQVKQQVNAQNPKILQNSENITNLQKQIKNIIQRLTDKREKINNIENKILKQKQQILKQVDGYKEENKIKFMEIKNERKKMEDSICEKIGCIDSNMEKLNLTIENQVLKKVQYRLGKQMKQIRTNISENNHRISDIKRGLQNNHEELGHIKDTVASKANFTDVVQAFDKKVDREDINNFINEKAEHLDTPKNKQFAKMSKSSSNQIVEKKKKCIFSRTRTPKQSYTKGCDQDIIKSVLEWEAPVTAQNMQSGGVIRTVKQQKQKMRHKSLRPSTANTLFLL